MTNMTAPTNPQEKELLSYITNNQPQAALNLIEQMTNINFENLKKHTPLHLAIYYGLKDVALALIKKNANTRTQMALIDPSSPIEHGLERLRNTKLDPALATAIKGTVKALVDYDSSLITEGYKYQTPLHTVSKNPLYLDLLAYFLENVACDVNKPTNARSTPLHSAASNNNEAAVQLLLAKKANPRALNNDQKTPTEVTWKSTLKKLLREKEMPSLLNLCLEKIGEQYPDADYSELNGELGLEVEPVLFANQLQKITQQKINALQPALEEACQKSLEAGANYIQRMNALTLKS